MGRTHALAGVAALWTLRLVPGALTFDTVAPLAFLAVVGALLPDLDAADSLLRRTSLLGITPLVPISSVLHQSFGHRGATHSLLGLVAAFLLALPFAAFRGWLAPVALSLGYASHLLCDGCTKSGVPLLYPRRRRYHLLPRPMRLTTGSEAENAVFALFGALAVGLLVSLLFGASPLSSPR